MAKKKKTSGNKKSLVRVVFDLSYVCYNQSKMIEETKECLYEDIMNAYKYSELSNYISVIDAPEATEDDVPEFLKEDFEE